MSLISLDPMFIKEFKVKPNKGSNLNLRSTFYNSEVRGIKDAKAYDVKGFGKDMTEKHSVSFKHPLVGLYGDYKADGQLSIIPLKAQGKGNVNLSKRKLNNIISDLNLFYKFAAGLDWTLSFNGEPDEKNGKTFLKIKNFVLKENGIDTCKFRLGNLFGPLGDALNEFLEENWRELYLEIDKKIFSNFKVILYNLIQDIFKRVPYNELFENNDKVIINEEKHSNSLDKSD